MLRSHVTVVAWQLIVMNAKFQSNYYQPRILVTLTSNKEIISCRKSKTKTKKVPQET